MHNTCKHARATHCDVALEAIGDTLELTITDDGIGMQKSDQDKESSLGIVGLRERVASLNGSFELISKPDAGTRIHCCFPQAGINHPAEPDASPV